MLLPRGQANYRLGKGRFYVRRPHYGIKDVLTAIRESMPEAGVITHRNLMIKVRKKFPRVRHDELTQIFHLATSGNVYEKYAIMGKHRLTQSGPGYQFYSIDERVCWPARKLFGATAKHQK